MIEPRQRNRRGFTLLTVLWLLSVGAVAAMSFALSGRVAVNSGRNRANMERGFWRAHGCARRMQAAIDSVLRESATPEDAARAWRTMPRRVGEAPLITGCDVRLEAAGAKLDLNLATPEMIANLAAALNMADRAEELAQSFDGWRNARLATRRAAFDDPRQLQLIPGFESHAAFDSVVSTDGGRVFLATAPVPVLMALPGVNREVAEAIVRLGEKDRPLTDLAEVAGMVSHAAAAGLTARFPDAVRASTPDPDAWMLISRAETGLPVVSVSMKWRLVRGGYQSQVLRVQVLE